MKLRCCGSGRQALEYVRENIAPLPAYSSITAEFSYFHIIPGFIRPAMEYFRFKLQDRSAYYRLCGFSFDEVKTTKTAQLDRKIDMVIGPGSQAMVFQIRFYAKLFETEDLTMPIYCDLDMTITIENFLHIIG